jgi:two-component system, OmpR family, sensor histidine kinase SaeS
MCGRLDDEMRGLLTIVQGYAELLADGQLNDELTVRSSAREILVSAQHMLALLENPADTLSLRSVDLVEWLAETTRTFGGRTPSHQVVADLPSGLPPVRIDPRQLGRVIHSLLSDAARCSEDGSLILLTAHVFAAGSVEIQIVDQGASAGADARSLATAGAVVEAHGGQIGMRSTPGRGSTVWVRLPSEVCGLPAEPPVWIDPAALAA